MTQPIIGVTLPDEINGEIPKQSDKQGWDKVLDSASEYCAKFWNGKYYNGYPINVETELKSGSKIVEEIKMKHELLKSFTNASKKAIKNDVKLGCLRKSYEFYVKHVNRKPYQIEFIRCEDNACNHCKSIPARRNELLDTIKMFGNQFPIPQRSVSKDHF